MRRTSKRHSQKSLQRWADASPSIPFAKKRCLQLQAPWTRQATGRRPHTSLSCACERHIELDFAISPALDRTFKKVNDAITRGLGPAKKAPEVKLSAIQYTVDSSVVGAADAYVVSLHWLLRADETENLLLGKTSLVLHGSRTDPGDVTLWVPTSKTDPRGNGASRRLTCICKLIAGMGDPAPDALSHLCCSPSSLSVALAVRMGTER